MITDGEMRRYAFFGHLIDAVEGYDKFGGWAIPFHDEEGHELVFKRPVVVSKLKRVRPMCEEEFVYLRAKTDHPAKVTIISAQQAAAYYNAETSKDAYPNIEAYLTDLVDILKTEVEELIRLGCTYIQIDAPQYAALIDPGIREGYRQRGTDPDKLLDRCIELDNAVIGNHPESILAFTFAAATTRANTMPAADMTRSHPCSAARSSIPSCLNMMMNARAVLNR